MSKNIVTVTFRGKLSYAKILGDPVLSYDKASKEWVFDLAIDQNTVKEAKKLGIGDRVKTKEDYLDGRPYLTFKQRELKKDGSPNFPIKVEDIRGKAWDQSKLLGNETDADVKFVIIDNPGMKKGVYVRSVRILNLVPYEKSEFTPIDEDDPFYKNLAAAEEMAAAAAQDNEGPGPRDDDLDDDISL